MIIATATVEDGRLIELTLAGHAECFGTLVERHKVALRKRIRSMVRNIADEDDVVQQAFMKAYCHLKSFRSESSFLTWITQIAANEVKQLNRRERRSALRPAPDDLEAFVSQCESPHRSLEQEEARRSVKDAVAKLPKKYRQILILRDLDQLSGQETARRLQLSVALVKTRLFRARLLLSAALQRRGQRLLPRESKRKAV